MECENCEGNGVIDVLYSDMTGISCSNEQAERLAGEVHHTELCETCGGTGELHRYLFIQSGIGSCADEAMDNLDFEAQVNGVDFDKPDKSLFPVDPPIKSIDFMPEDDAEDLVCTLWLDGKELEILKDEMEK